MARQPALALLPWGLIMGGPLAATRAVRPAGPRIYLESRRNSMTLGTKRPLSGPQPLEYGTFNAPMATKTPLQNQFL